MQTITIPITLRELSGDIRNRLTGILGSAHILLSEMNLSPEQREWVNRIEQAGQALKLDADKLLLAKQVN